MVIVNTVVIVQAGLGLGQPQTALALGAYGAGSMIAALALPRLLDRAPDRPVMLVGAVMLAAALALGPMVESFGALLALWFVLGVGTSVTQTPGGRLLRRSAHPEDRPAVFAAQFALSHACWLLTYPVAGWLGAKLGMPVAFLALASIAAVAVAAALALWPKAEIDAVEHAHPELTPDHPHLREALAAGRDHVHAHSIVIDRLHPQWPDAGRS
jgi:MFS family permease